MSALSTRITGQVLAAKTSTFEDKDGDVIEYGKIQIMHKDMGGDFYSITNIKVKSTDFSWLPEIEKHIGKTVTLDLSQQLYNGKASLYLAAPFKPAPVTATKPSVSN